MTDNPTERLILHFHGVGAVPTWVDGTEQQYWCESDRFGAILDSICALENEVPIEITFDDGNASDVAIALPALAARGLKAKFFVCAGRIGERGYLDSSGLKDITSAGMDVGSHGWSHVDWRQVDDRTLDIEINAAREKIEQIVDRSVRQVAIPFGSYDRRVLGKLRKSSVETVFNSDGGRAPMTGWMLPREVFRCSWDDRTLLDMATGSISARARLRHSVVRLIKRLR